MQKFLNQLTRQYESEIHNVAHQLLTLVDLRSLLVVTGGTDHVILASHACSDRPAVRRSHVWRCIRKLLITAGSLTHGPEHVAEMTSQLCNDRQGVLSSAAGFITAVCENRCAGALDTARDSKSPGTRPPRRCLG